MIIKNIKKILLFTLVFSMILFIISCEKKVEITTISEGVDTITSVEYENFNANNKDLFLKEGDKIAVISPSATPSREQVDKTMEASYEERY